MGFRVRGIFLAKRRIDVASIHQLNPFPRMLLKRIVPKTGKKVSLHFESGSTSSSCVGTSSRRFTHFSQKCQTSRPCFKTQMCSLKSELLSHAEQPSKRFNIGGEGSNTLKSHVYFSGWKASGEGGGWVALGVRYAWYNQQLCLQVPAGSLSEASSLWPSV